MLATALAAASGFFLSNLSGNTPWLVYLGIFLFGGFSLPLYSLSAAHANDQAKPGQFVIISAGLTFFFSLGGLGWSADCILDDTETSGQLLSSAIPAQSTDPW